MLQLITDRMQSDVDRISTILKTPRALRTPQQQEELDSAASKGSYNYTDLNRVTAAMEYLVEQLNKYEYSVDYQKIKIDHPAEGLLPDGYTQLEYIESTGQQYINTGFMPNGKSKIAMNLTPLSDSSNACFFCARNETSATAGTTYTAFYLSSNYYRFDFYGKSGQSDGVDAVGTNINIEASGGVCKIGSKTITNAASTAASSMPWILLASARTSSISDLANMATAKLYSCQIYDNGALVRNFIPCKNLSGEIGLYDAVNGQFYANAGKGKFISGTEIVNESSDENKDPYLWYEEDIPTMEQMERYLLNAVNIYNALLSNPELPATMAQLNYTGANQIEKAMLLVEETIERVVKSMCRSNAFTFWSGNRPLPSADSDLGRTWEELDAMNVPWENLETADWFLLAYGNLGVTK